MTMPSDAHAPEEPAFNGRLVARLALASFAVLLAAGGLMWWRYGPAIFLDVLTSLQNCF